MQALHCRHFQHGVAQAPSTCTARPRHRKVTTGAQGGAGPALSVKLEDQPAVTLPASQEAAVQEACSSTVLRLKPRFQGSKGPSRGFASAAPGQLIVGLELPVPDSALAELGVQLAGKLADKLGSACVPMALVYAQPGAAAIAAGLKKQMSCKVWDLREACRTPQIAGGLLILVAPSIADVALCQQLVSETWTGNASVLVNAEFLTKPAASLGLPQPLQAFVEGVEVVYCFLPVEVKGLLGNLEGAVLKQAGTGQAAGMWRILLQVSNKFVQVGQTKSRPSGEELEMVFINAKASSSPLTGLAKLASKFSGKK